MNQTRLDRKLLKRPDYFVEQGRVMLQRLVGQRRALIGFALTLVAITGVYYVYNGLAEKRIQADWVAYYEASQKPVAERAAALKAVYEKASNSRAKQLAAASLGDHYALSQKAKQPGNKGEDPEAKLSAAEVSTQSLDWYAKAQDFSFLQPLEKDLLTLNTAAVLEGENKLAEAASRYDAVAKSSTDAKPLGQLHSARLLEKGGKKDDARKLYRAIATDYPSTDYARIARNYLRRMDSPLFSSPAGKP